MRIEGIILKKIPIREFDELVVCYTPEMGKQTYHVRSILRSTSKQRSHIDVLNHIDFDLVSAKQVPIIVSARCIRSFIDLKSSLPALSMAYWLVELFDKMVFEGEADPQLWQFLQDCFCKFDEYASQPDFNWAPMLEDTGAELLKVMGYPTHAGFEELVHGKLYAPHFFRNVIELV